MSVLTNAVASSSKRPAPSPATPLATPAKRPRAESHDDDDDEDHDGEHDESLQELDESTRAKIARKEARTIRNRESAQRSRNQRKAHLANLEHRVAELERENRALRGESGSTPPPSRSAEREVSPANSVMSLANDLGLPHEMVSSSGGVSLATVAPPPAGLDVDVDVKPVVPVAAAPSPPLLVSAAPVFADVTALQNENAALRERIGLLENLVKQVVALSNLGGIPTSAPAPVQPEAASPDSVQAFDWDTLAAPAQPSRLETTLSPSMFPTQPLDAVAQTSGGDLCFPEPGPAAGEEPFIFGNLGNDFGAYGNDGQGGCRHGETSGLGRDQVNLDLDASAFQGGQTSGPVGAFEAGVFEDGQEMGETWDEGMKTLLNNLEAVGGGAGEQVVRQENEWFGGWGYQKGNTTVLGLAV